MISLLLTYINTIFILKVPIDCIKISIFMFIPILKLTDIIFKAYSGHSLTLHYLLRS